MYKKLLCSIFCVAFLLIVIAIIIYTYTSSRNPEEKEDAPAIAIYLNDLHKNRRFIIPYEQSGTDKQVIIDRVKLGLPYTTDTFKPKSLLLFVCNASFPVQWKYLGYGSVYGNVHYRRDVRDFDDKKTYRFSTVIEFTAISEYITGFYECSGFISKQPVNGVYVFAPGNKTFITRTELEMEIDKNKISTWIPCPVSDPKVNVSLRRVILPHETIGVVDEKQFLDEKSFDPKRGFPLKKLFVATERKPWGIYFCHDETHNVYSPIVKVLQPLDEIATYSLPQTHFVDGKNKTYVSVSCTCKDEIYFEILNFKFNTKQIREKRKKQHKKGEIRIRIPLDKFTNNSVLNCVTTNGYRVLFSWKFLENGTFLKNSSEIMKTARLEYDNATRMFSCCTNSSQRPEIKVLDCSTEGECFLKLTDLKMYSHEGHKLFKNLTTSPSSDEGCKTIKVGSLPRGLLQCSLDKYSLQTTYYIDTTRGTKLKRGLVSTSPDLIMKVEQISIKRIAGRGMEIGFHCYGPKFFIAQGIQWAKGFHNGLIEYLINQSNSTDVSSKDVINDWIYITLSDQQVARIYCMAPVIESSNEWLNVSTGVNYTSGFQGSF